MRNGDNKVWGWIGVSSFVTIHLSIYHLPMISPFRPLSLISLTHLPSCAASHARRCGGMGTKTKRRTTRRTTTTRAERQREPKEMHNPVGVCVCMGGGFGDWDTVLF